MKNKIIELQPSTSQLVNESTPLLMNLQPSTSQVINRNNEIQNQSLIQEINNSQNEKSLCDFANETMIEIISCEGSCCPPLPICEGIKCTIL